jgi:hypothetical protein
MWTDDLSIWLARSGLGLDFLGGTFMAINMISAQRANKLEQAGYKILFFLLNPISVFRWMLSRLSCLLVILGLVFGIVFTAEVLEPLFSKYVVTLPPIRWLSEVFFTISAQLDGFFSDRKVGVAMGLVVVGLLVQFSANKFPWLIKRIMRALGLAIWTSALTFIGIGLVVGILLSLPEFLFGFIFFLIIPGIVFLILLFFLLILCSLLLFIIASPFEVSDLLKRRFGFEAVPTAGWILLATGFLLQLIGTL